MDEIHEFFRIIKAKSIAEHIGIVRTALIYLYIVI
ncbi:hypothetical protein NMY3_02872 [Candidatus Nitrosocosmicus oleophilus]|uniref:Uncharacterized protein n=1 Tax=Candidatus Nitrosocosmicus oleophilus TaxID=1353260 RepID=A0A654M3E6_9ARCH|nr:hypothetical protein NMY3_02872 [Candidatus Nitrosocosmicus oleophilus]